MRADLARHAFLDLAVARGATVETGQRVESLDDVDADVVVVTAGAWIRELVPDVPVQVTRETLAYFRHDGAPCRRSSSSTRSRAGTGCTRSTTPSTA